MVKSVFGMRTDHKSAETLKKTVESKIRTKTKILILYNSFCMINLEKLKSESFIPTINGKQLA